MTSVERLNAVFDFQKPDRLPKIEWAAWWGLTLDRWLSEGLTKDCTWDRYQNYFGLDYMRRIWMPLYKADCPKPKTHGAPLIFEEEEYADFKKKYLFPEAGDAGYDAKLAALKSLKEEHDKGDAIVWFSYDGFFWFPRTLLGIEPHLYSFYDYPEFYHRICEDTCSYILSKLDVLFDVLKPEFFVLSEDMSYNNGPMISESLYDEFLLPYYNRLIPEIHKRGCKVIIDSDGDISMMIPWFKKAGIDGVLPLERQAGVDINALREKYPDFLFLGGFDKMTMVKGEKEMRAEFERLLPAMKSGGFVPSVDHQTPPGVSLENYRIYLKLLDEYASKAVM